MGEESGRVNIVGHGCKYMVYAAFTFNGVDMIKLASPDMCRILRDLDVAVNIIRNSDELCNEISFSIQIINCERVGFLYRTFRCG